MAEEVPRTLTHQYYIDAPPERVFQALTDPAGLVRWLADRAEIEPRRGGRYSLGWTNGPTHTGVLVDFEPGRTVAFAWEWPGVELKGTVLRLTVHRQERGTLLAIEHTGFPREERWTDVYGGAEWGWTYFAMNLKSVLETGRDLRSPHDG